VSDRVGRRPVMLAALGISILASALLIAGGSGLAWLLAGRLIAGIASGAAFSSGTAWIKELSAPAGDGPGGASHGPRRATVLMTAGFAGGPLVAGLLAQWAPAPTVLPYLPHLALALVALPLAATTRETRQRGRAGAPRPRLRASGVGQPRFAAVVLPLAPWVFGSASIALAYLPGLVERQLRGSALVFAAAVCAMTALAGIAVQPLARRLDRPGRPRLIWASLTLVIAGLLIAAAAAAEAQPALVVVAVIVLGAGYGCCQVCGLLEVQRLAEPASLAGLTAVYQAASYLGFAAPFLLAAAARIASPGVLLAGLAVLAGLTLAWLARAARTGHRTPPGSIVR